MLFVKDWVEFAVRQTVRRKYTVRWTMVVSSYIAVCYE